MNLLLPLSLIWPLLLAIILSTPRRSFALALIPTAALPALLLAAFPGLTLELPGVLLGMRLAVDETGLPFLLLAGLIWTAAGIYARTHLADDPRQVRFQLLYLLTLTGNLGAILALDVASFYLFFALMTFSTYGLIVHDGSPAAYGGGRVYMVLAIIGESLLLVALILIAFALGNANLHELGPWLAAAPDRGLIVFLILTSFAIKIGAVPLHVWLPAAYSRAPIPGSVVLGGIITKMGLLGWLRFLPVGEVALPNWGNLCLAVGLVSAFYGVLAGLPQSHPKSVLAYSSISQMGLITILLGIGLVNPEDWPLILTTLLLFSLHHGLAKAALFLGVGVAVRGRRWAGWGLLLPSLALAGAPLTSGALAKSLLKEASHLAPGDWAIWLPALLTLSSLATALLMARFLFLAWPRGAKEPTPVGLWIPWLGLLIAGMVLPWWWAGDRLPQVVDKAFAPDQLLGNLWPVLGAGILTALVWGIWRITGFHLRLPEGDILHLFIYRSEFHLHPAVEFTTHTPDWVFHYGHPHQALALLKKAEWRLRSWSLAGILFLLLTVVLVLLSGL